MRARGPAAGRGPPPSLPDTLLAPGRPPRPAPPRGPCPSGSARPGAAPSLTLTPRSPPCTGSAAGPGPSPPFADPRRRRARASCKDRAHSLEARCPLSCSPDSCVEPLPLSGSLPARRAPRSPPSPSRFPADTGSPGGRDLRPLRSWCLGGPSCEPGPPAKASCLDPGLQFAGCFQRSVSIR